MTAGVRKCVLRIIQRKNVLSFVNSYFIPLKMSGLIRYNIFLKITTTIQKNSEKFFDKVGQGIFNGYLYPLYPVPPFKLFDLFVWTFHDTSPLSLYAMQKEQKKKTKQCLVFDVPEYSLYTN